MSRLFVALTFALLASSLPAAAFWPRSHFAACAEAANEAEWTRLKCWIFAPVYEWPIPQAGLAPRYGYGSSYGYGAPAVPRWRK